MNSGSSYPSDPGRLLNFRQPFSRILLVDDSTTILQVYKLALVSATRELVAATNGFDALTEARKQSFNLIVLDIQMPGIDGIEVCRELKLDFKTRPIPILFASGSGISDEEAASLGAVGLLKKPFPLAVLREAVLKWERPQLKEKKSTPCHTQPGATFFHV